MKIIATSLVGVHIIESVRRPDARGYFARTWCADVLRAHGLVADIAQINVAHNPFIGTLRGMHLQSAPHGEVKVVRCPRGAVYDVIVDLRPSSATYKQHVGIELSAENGLSLYVPEGCAHGYQVLQEGSELQYLTSKPYAPSHATGVRFDDPAFRIAWPLPVTLVSDQDRAWPLYDASTRIAVKP